MLTDEGDHLVVRHGLDVRALDGVLLKPVLDELVGPVAHLAGLAVDERVVEGGDVAGGDPDLGVHEDGGIEPDVIGVLLDELLPPGLFDVVFELRAEGAVVPAVGKTAVDLAPGVDEAPVLAQGHELFHRLFRVFHFLLPFPQMASAEIFAYGGDICYNGSGRAALFPVRSTLHNITQKPAYQQ